MNVKRLEIFQRHFVDFQPFGVAWLTPDPKKIWIAIGSGDRAVKKFSLASMMVRPY